MSRQPNPYNQILQILHQLHIDHPTFNLGRHLSTVIDEHGDVWGVTDKELLFSFMKYQTQLEMDSHFTTTEEEDIQKILRDGQDIENILNEEEDNGY